MNYRTLGRTGLSVSEIGLGALEIGRDWPSWRKDLGDFARPDEPSAIALVEEAISHGVNFVDTAPAYMESERVVGSALKGRRNQLILATKCGEWFDGAKSVYDFSYGETFRFVERSLRNLGTDWIDLLQIHSGSVEVIRRGETLSAMKVLQEQGKARYLGISVDTEEAALEAIRCGGFDCIQLSYHLLDRVMENRVIPEAEAAGVGIIVKDSLSKGRLTSKAVDIADAGLRERIGTYAQKAASLSISLPQYALRFVLSNSGISTVIVGTKRRQHLLENLQCIDRPELSMKVSEIERHPG